MFTRLNTRTGLLLAALLTMPFASALPTQAGTGLGTLTFRENNGCGGDAKSFSDAPGNYTMGNYGWNDEARSLELFNVGAPTTIYVYDSSSGSTTDDWTEIHISASVSYLCINTFHQTVTLYENGNEVGWMNNRYNNGLDGKVSLVRVR